MYPHRPRVKAFQEPTHSCQTNMRTQGDAEPMVALMPLKR
jgi:hypothetical protein